MTQYRISTPIQTGREQRIDLNFTELYGLVGGIIPQARLTLTTAVPVTTTDVTGATTIYATPYGGNHIPVYDGSVINPRTLSADLSLALDSNSGHTGYHQSGKNFDLFAINDSGTNRLGTGPAWSSSTTRGTGAGTTELETFNGLLVNKNTATIRFGSSSGNTVSVAARQATFLGSFRAIANGQAEDSKLNRLLSNAYNVAQRDIQVHETATTWTYSTATYRIANNNSANKASVLFCLNGGLVDCTVVGAVENSDASITPGLHAAIGLDGSTSPAPTSTYMYVTIGANPVQVFAFYKGNPGLGYHEFSWIESGGGTADTQTWYGTDLAVNNCGLTGHLWN